ncbi:hypothetical protein PR048_026612 [Dryococelus australis]|uniref:Uncharacterized protein n=1 Tax=Dryococelus australis TaxID=614101 RepID=A0ABQ9GLU7_9NEOP|nr:hypothetical protein PR048_026612 [Dryococelus australis]
MSSCGEDGDDPVVHTPRKNVFQKVITKYEFRNIDKSVTPIENHVKEAELRTASYLSVHITPFSAMDHLVEVMKINCPDSKIVLGMVMKRNKATAVVKNVIGATHKYVFSEKLNQFWDIAEVFPSCDAATTEQGATGARLYEIIMKSFSDCNMPNENIILLQQWLANITRCEACDYLPRRCEDLTINIYNYMKCSAKRQSQISAYQKFLELKAHKLLHPAQTRWLSLLAVVERVIEEWDALLLFFSDKWQEDCTMAAEEIFSALRDPFMKLFYIFQKWVLPKFVSVNKYFQYEKVVLTVLKEKMASSFRELRCAYMQQDYVASTPLCYISPDSEQHFLGLQNLYFGTERIRTPSRLDVVNQVKRAKPVGLCEMQQTDDEWRRLAFETLPDDVSKEEELEKF